VKQIWAKVAKNKSPPLLGIKSRSPSPQPVFSRWIDNCGRFLLYEVDSRFRL